MTEKAHGIEAIVQGERSDTGDKIVKFTNDRSKAIVFIDSDDGVLYVFYVNSDVRGDMKDLIDEAVSLTQYSDVRFLSPHDDEISGAIDTIANKLAPSSIKVEKDDSRRNIRDAVNYYKEEIGQYGQQRVNMLYSDWQLD